MSKQKKGVRLALTIPLATHLKKFLYWHEHIVDEDQQLDFSCTYAIDRKHSLCAYMLKLMLEGKATIPPYYEGPKKTVAEIEDHIQVELNTRAFRDGRFMLSEQSILNFNKIVSGVFVDKMVDYILLDHARTPSGHKFQEKDSIQNFMALVGLTDEDANWESLKKASYRVRHYRGLPMFRRSEVNTGENEFLQEKIVKMPPKNPFSLTNLSLAV